MRWTTTPISARASAAPASCWIRSIPAGEHANSALNVPYRFVAAATYRTDIRGLSGWKKDILNGWGIAPIVQMQSGLPYSAGTSRQRRAAACTAASSAPEARRAYPISIAMPSPCPRRQSWICASARASAGSRRTIPFRDFGRGVQPLQPPEHHIGQHQGLLRHRLRPPLRRPPPGRLPAGPVAAADHEQRVSRRQPALRHQQQLQQQHAADPTPDCRLQAASTSNHLASMHLTRHKGPVHSRDRPFGRVGNALLPHGG